MSSSLPSRTCASPDPAATTGALGSRSSVYGVSTEYGLHCLLWLAREDSPRASSRDLAELQGVSPSMLAKIMTKLEKAGIVTSMNGIAGGYVLARGADQISVLDVAQAIEGDRHVFDCKEVRRGCVLFDGEPPIWSTAGVCGIHAVMLRAEKAMREELARTSLSSLVAGVRRPAEFDARMTSWFELRSQARQRARTEGVKEARRRARWS